MVAAGRQRTAQVAVELMKDLHRGLVNEQRTVGRRNADGWHLRHDSLGEAQGRPAWRFVANESIVLLAAAAEVLGVACLPQSFCPSDLERGRLRRVLPGWTAGWVTTILLIPHRRGELPAVRAVVEHLGEQFAKRTVNAPRLAGVRLRKAKSVIRTELRSKP